MSTDKIDTSNIQGDIITGIPKKAQAFFFFQITNVPGFKAALARFIPSIATETSVAQAQKDIAAHKASQAGGLLPLSYVTVAFTHKGLVQLGAKDNIGDDVFTAGQLADSKALGDRGTTQGTTFEPDWLFPFKHDIHGLFSISASSTALIQPELATILLKFNITIREVYRVIGNTRPGLEDGHEHFGFDDGISNPAIDNLSQPFPGDRSVAPGIMLLGRTGDTVTRPAWAVDGSFLAFRLLNQLVPEFNQFLSQNALKTGDPTVSGADLLGARLLGRWKSGAPIALSPLKDDPTTAADKQLRNKFQYDFDSQEKCPFAAHTRKTYPRNDIDEESDNVHRIIRRGIAFGPEVTQSELANKRTEHDRGLLFVCYQSNVKQGFQFIQQSWANNVDFPFNKTQKPPGFDAIIGQNSNGPNDVGERTLIGTDPGNTANSLSLGMQEFVVPKGGEYFFTPSISALKTTLTAATS